ncbi:hypothetical protein [Lacrimispora brassicae]
MNRRFQLFEQWYKNQIPVWEQNTIFIDKVYQSDYAHQYHIELHSENGLGRISLYESNDIYWVDFEAGSVNADEMFFRANISYHEIEDIVKENEEFIQYMTL